jgi:HD-like signal output (HDOD) protein
VGAYLLGLWGLPDPIVEAVAFHHRPQDCPANSFVPLAAVHIADAIQYGDPGSRSDTGVEPARMDVDFLSKLDLNERIEIWRDDYSQMISGGNNA